MQNTEQYKNIAAALTAASNAIGAAKKDGKNPHYKSTYATLSSVINAANKPLLDNNLSIAQEMGCITKSQTIKVVTRLTHTSGEYLETITEAPLKNKDIHVLMSTFTYCRRNAISALLNMPVEDDDGNKSHDAKPEFDTLPLLQSIEACATLEQLNLAGNVIKTTQMDNAAKNKLRSAWNIRKQFLDKAQTAETEADT